MTLTDDLHDTAAALQAGWPIENINRARRVRAKEQRTMSDLHDLEDLIERATPILRELRRACSGYARFTAADDDLASALVAVDPDALVTGLIGDDHEPWVVETPEFRITSTVNPAVSK